MNQSSCFPVASRRSPLARTQALLVRNRIARAAGFQEAEAARRMPLKTYVTTGDENLSGTLADAGGKGLFTGEIEQALLSGKVRIAVHSMKDMPVHPPRGLVLAAIPAREDPRECFLSPVAPDPRKLPPHARIGTVSVRRIAQSLHMRPDLEPVPMRGNVGTRLEKLAGGHADGTYLAFAGLKRLGLAEMATCILDPEDMLPPPGQGALYVQTREDDMPARALAAAIACPVTTLCIAAERAFLAELGGSCRTPAGALARFENGVLRIHTELLSPDGKERITACRRIKCTPEDIAAARSAGTKAGTQVRMRAGKSYPERFRT